MSPIHLIFPVLEVNAEVRLHNKFGLAVIGGYGQTKVSDSFNTYKFNILELGGQALFYPISTFDEGLQLGAEILYVYVDTKDYSGSVKLAGSGSGLAIGPLVGYKLTTKTGFTFVAQGGAQYMAMRATASDSTGQTASKGDSRIIALLNLNVGWSF